MATGGKLWRVASLMLVVSSMPAAVMAQDLKPAIDNSHVTVWDVTWRKGATNPLRRANTDVLVLSVGGPDAPAATFVRRKTAYKLRAPDGSRVLFVALKDAAAARYENTSGYPPAFPRPGVRRLLENDRVVVWLYWWTHGEPTPMHFHDKDALVVYLEPTALVSTTPDGTQTRSDHAAFEIRFNSGNRTHTELLAGPAGSAMITEFK